MIRCSRFIKGARNLSRNFSSTKGSNVSKRLINEVNITYLTQFSLNSFKLNLHDLYTKPKNKNTKGINTELKKEIMFLLEKLENKFQFGTKEKFRIYLSNLKIDQNSRLVEIYNRLWKIEQENTWKKKNIDNINQIIQLVKPNENLLIDNLNINLPNCQYFLKNSYTLDLILKISSTLKEKNLKLMAFCTETYIINCQNQSNLDDFLKNETSSKLRTTYSINTKNNINLKLEDLGNLLLNQTTQILKDSFNDNPLNLSTHSGLKIFKFYLWKTSISMEEELLQIDEIVDNCIGIIIENFKILEIEMKKQSNFNCLMTFFDCLILLINKFNFENSEKHLILMEQIWTHLSLIDIDSKMMIMIMTQLLLVKPVPSLKHLTLEFLSRNFSYWIFQSNFLEPIIFFERYQVFTEISEWAVMYKCLPKSTNYNQLCENQTKYYKEDKLKICEFLTSCFKILHSNNLFPFKTVQFLNIHRIMMFFVAFFERNLISEEMKVPLLKLGLAYFTLMNSDSNFNLKFLNLLVRSRILESIKIDKQIRILLTDFLDTIAFLLKEKVKYLQNEYHLSQSVVFPIIDQNQEKIFDKLQTLGIIISKKLSTEIKFMRVSIAMSHFFSKISIKFFENIKNDKNLLELLFYLSNQNLTNIKKVSQDMNNLKIILSNYFLFFIKIDDCLESSLRVNPMIIESFQKIMKSFLEFISKNLFSKMPLNFLIDVIYYFIQINKEMINKTEFRGIIEKKLDESLDSIINSYAPSLDTNEKILFPGFFKNNSKNLHLLPILINYFKIKLTDTQLKGFVQVYPYVAKRLWGSALVDTILSLNKMGIRDINISQSLLSVLSTLHSHVYENQKVKMYSNLTQFLPITRKIIIDYFLDGINSPEEILSFKESYFYNLADLAGTIINDLPKDSLIKLMNILPFDLDYRLTYFYNRFFDCISLEQWTLFDKLNLNVFCLKKSEVEIIFIEIIQILKNLKFSDPMSSEMLSMIVKFMTKNRLFNTKIYQMIFSLEKKLSGKDINRLVWMYPPTKLTRPDYFKLMWKRKNEISKDGWERVLVGFLVNNLKENNRMRIVIGDKTNSQFEESMLQEVIQHVRQTEMFIKKIITKEGVELNLHRVVSEYNLDFLNINKVHQKTTLDSYLQLDSKLVTDLDTNQICVWDKICHSDDFQVPKSFQSILTKHFIIKIMGTELMELGLLHSLSLHKYDILFQDMMNSYSEKVKEYFKNKSISGNYNLSNFFIEYDRKTKLHHMIKQSQFYFAFNDFMSQTIVIEDFGNSVSIGNVKVNRVKCIFSNSSNICNNPVLLSLQSVHTLNRKYNFNFFSHQGISNNQYN